MLATIKKDIHLRAQFEHLNHLKDKSLKSEMSAVILEGSFYHSSSVHCSYYSVLQLMKHFCLSENNITEIAFSSNKPQITGNHVYVLDEFLKLLDSKYVSSEDQRAFKRLVNDLKHVRVEADYKNTPCEQLVGIAAKEKADQILKEINKYFG